MTVPEATQSAAAEELGIAGSAIKSAAAVEGAAPVASEQAGSLVLQADKAVEGAAPVAGEAEDLAEDD
eukprot:8666526-Prorocentrum_lima.AAC.1